MSDDRKYVRVYYNDLIRDYPGVWADNDQLATWLRLLSTADPMWPTPPELPRSVKQRILDKLVASTLVLTLVDHRYRMKGMDAERERRADAGRIAAAKRWHPDGIGSPDATALPKQAKQSKDETSKDESAAGARADVDDPATTYWQLTGRFPTEKTLAWIDDLTAKYGLIAVDRALAKSYIEDRSTQTLLGRAQDKLRAEARELDRKERVDELRRLQEKRATQPPSEPWRDEYRQRIQERYGDAA